jgi:phenylalanyl-tRNA synthetase alpha chain
VSDTTAQPAPAISDVTVSAAVDAALAAISAASDVAGLKVVKTEHLGEASPRAKL